LEKPVNVKILDQNYLIKSDQDENEVQRVAEFINSRFKEIRNGATGLSESKIAILGAFYIAAEYLQALSNHEKTLRDIQDRAKRLNIHIDSIEK
jgi:cell division protein ZapA